MERKGNRKETGCTNSGLLKKEKYVLKLKSGGEI